MPSFFLLRGIIPTILLIIWLIAWSTIVIWFILVRSIHKNLEPVSQLIIESNGKIKLQKKSLTRSMLENGTTDPSILDFTSDDPKLPPEFYIGFNSGFPQVNVFIPFNSPELVLWSKKYLGVDKKYESEIEKLFDENFQAEIIVSCQESWHIMSRHANILCAMFHESKVSSTQIHKALEILAKIDLIICKSPSRVIPKPYRTRSPYDLLIIVSCTRRKCRNFIGVKDDFFEDMPERCSYCNTKRKQIPSHYSRNK
jgi:hypothetical protein